MPKNLQSGLSTVCRAPVGLLISLEGIKSIWIFPGCRKVGFPGGKCDGSLSQRATYTFSLLRLPLAMEVVLPCLAVEMHTNQFFMGIQQLIFILGESHEPLFYSEKLMSKHVTRFYTRFSQSESFNTLPVLNTCSEVFLSTRCIFLSVKEVKRK